MLRKLTGILLAAGFAMAAGATSAAADDQAGNLRLQAFGGDAQLTAIKHAVERFNKTYPNVKVEIAIDPISSGTLVRADGSAVALTSADFEMTPEKFWQSDKTKANYLIGWRIAVPKERLAFKLRPVMPNQELALEPLIYWEGACDLEGERDGKPIRGHGYLELTGYAAPLQELNR